MRNKTGKNGDLSHGEVLVCTDCVGLIYIQKLAHPDRF